MSPRTQSKRIAKQFGARLKAARKLSGKTQDQLAAIADCSAVTLSKIETGTSLPTLDIMLALSYALNVSPNELIGWDVSPRDDIPASKLAALTELTFAAEQLSEDWLDWLLSFAKKLAQK